MSQKCDSEILDLANKKHFIPIDIYLVLKSTKKNYLKYEIYCSLSGKISIDKEYQLVFKVWNKFWKENNEIMI